MKRFENAKVDDLGYASHMDFKFWAYSDKSDESVNGFKYCKLVGK